MALSPLVILAEGRGIVDKIDDTRHVRYHHTTAPTRLNEFAKLDDITMVKERREWPDQNPRTSQTPRDGKRETTKLDDERLKKSERPETMENDSTKLANVYSGQRELGLEQQIRKGR